MNPFLYLLLGILLGCVIGWLLRGAKKGAPDVRIEDELRKQAEAAKADLEKSTSERLKAEGARAAADASRQAAEQQWNSATEQLSLLASELKAANDRLADLTAGRLRRRWFKRTQRGASVRPVQWLGVLVLAIAFFLGIFSWADSFSPVVFVAALLLVVAGVAIYRAGRYRDRIPLPVPDFEILKAEWDKPEDSQARQAREIELEAEATQNLSRKPGKEQREYLIAESYGALKKCDYLRAHVFARLYLKRDQKCVEAKIALVVASAAFRQQAQVTSLLSSLLHITGFHSLSTQWGAGWALLLSGDWASAEAMLEATRRKQPNGPTVAALIALCQSQRNKLHSAIANARTALSAAPQSNVRTELLTDLLLNMGCLKEAEELLTGADAIGNDPRLVLLMIRLQLLRCDFECADQWIAKFRQAGIDGRNNVQLGLACETARRDELAAGFYSSALALGYFPEAYLGRARLAAHRKQRDVARQHIIAALNVNRPLGERAVGSLQVFVQALQLLLQLEEPISNARA